jgi:hypothetical protein
MCKGMPRPLADICFRAAASTPAPAVSARVCADRRALRTRRAATRELGHGAVPWPKTMKNPCKRDVGFVFAKRGRTA